MNITTLNINTDSIKALTFTADKAERQEIALPPGMLRNGLILQPEALAGQLKSLIKTGRLNKDRIICTVNGLPFSYRLVNMPAMEPEAFNEAVVRTAKNEMSFSPEEMYLSWQAFPAEKDEWQVLVTGITRHPVDNLIKAFSIAGIRPWLLDLPHLALARLSPHPDAVILDLEKDCSNIVMLVEGVPRGMHMVPALNAGATVRDQAGQVMEKLSRMIEFYNGGHPAGPVKEPVSIFVTGELLNDRQAMDYLETQAGYNVKALTVNNKTLSGLPFNQLAVNAGSGMMNTGLEKYTRKGSVPCRYFNLEKIAREQRPKTDVPKIMKKVLVPALLIAGVGLLAASYMTYTKVQAVIPGLQADLDRANTELAQWQETSSRAAQVESDIREMAARVKQIEAGKIKIFSSTGYVDDISSIVSCMPEGMTFDRLEMGYSSITLQGSSAEALPVVLFANRLEMTENFSEALISWIDAPHDSVNGQVHLFRIEITRAAG